jgi:hypothetical protein
MTTQTELKQRISKVLDTLPEDKLSEVALFLEYLQYKQGRRSAQRTPYTPVAMGNLWAGVTITDDDIAEVRRDI